MAAKRSRLNDTIRTTKAEKPTPVADVLRADTGQKTTRRTTIYLSEQTWRELKIRTVEEGTNVSSVIENLIQAYLQDKK